jgi:hypothetical protein
MCKKVMLVLALSALTGAAVTPLNAADYKHSGCSEAARMRFPADHAARKQFKHWCKNQWKIYKKEHP